MALTKTCQYYLGRVRARASRTGASSTARPTPTCTRSCPRCNLLMVISVVGGAACSSSTSGGGAGCSRSSRSACGASSRSSSARSTRRSSSASSVQPNEFAKEQPYIERNIAATRAAFGLDNDHDEARSTTTHDLDRDRSSTTTSTTLDNARLWDPTCIAQRPTRSTRSSQPFYQFADVDVDRYTIDGADDARSLSGGARARTAAHLPEQHVDEPAPRVHARLRRRSPSPANAANGDGSPSYLLSATSRRQGEHRARRSTQPERLLRRGPRRLRGRRHARSPSRRRRRGQHDTTTRYQGAGRRAGCRASLRKAAFALRFGDWNLFVSGQVTRKSRILYLRDVRERVQTAAPFLKFDADPYPVDRRRPDRVGARRLHDDATTTRTRSRSTRTSRRAAGSTPTSTTCATR